MNPGSPFHRVRSQPHDLSRREFLWRSGGGLGGVALSKLLTMEAGAQSSEVLARTDLTDASRLPHHAPRAKRVIQLFMAGAASHIDLFDYKPALVKHHGKPSDFGEKVEAFQDGLGPWMKPVWKFQSYGQSGRMLSEVVSDLAPVVDELAFVHNVVGKTGVHSQATMLQATGFQSPGFPGAGCWVSYGLGSLNENLPTFVVLPDHRGFASNGPKNWDSAFLPGNHAGTVINPGSEEPIRDLFPGRGGKFVNKESEGEALALLEDLNRAHAKEGRSRDSRLEARIRSYELAARMQLAAPE
ncbi:MAG: DUF1501 domain-containing protein, partial [Verrucomicrobia bacterium]|nr:DUF1501 domain-containing protein [Verrucomicrobiota bacterium]